MSDVPKGAVRRPVERHRAHDAGVGEDWIAAELPVAIHCNGEPHVVMMATPDDLADFALGFSLSEGIIARADELEEVVETTLLEGVQLSLRIPAARGEAVARRRRNLTGQSSCGLCGTQELEDVVRHPPRVA
ncbi:MAG: formate dehydrogenase accessory sulfurtransferase FdhD, partial [Xanthomonadales bacterium]|nr:formate dehydrogenase accessory sulfurtransferase FdhD [Xanthomonadales bacterium]